MKIKLLLIFVVAWLSTTLVVDFIAVPSAFKVLGSKVIAGRIGMRIFSLYNYIELFFALVIVTLAILTKAKKSLKVLSGLTLVISIIYFIHFTPTIIDTNNERAEVSSSASINSPRMTELNTQHDRYHKLYRNFDILKIVLLLSMIVVIVRDKQESE